jgi:2-alkyl-3-oxoalkanoate reductase
LNTKRIVLVTGGGGFLGGAIVRSLLSHGDRVRTFSRNRHPDLDALPVDQIQGQLADAHHVRKACADVEAVFHTAAKAGVWGTYDAYYQTNVTGTQNIIDACRRCGVARLIYTSSPSVVFDGHDMEGVDESAPYPATYPAPYPETKALAEQAVCRAARSGVPAIVLRPHLIWGPGDNHLVPRILERASKLRRIGSGTQRVDTIYIDNAVHAHILAETCLKANPGLSGRIYFVSQDDPVPLWTMVNYILAAGDRPPVQKSISPSLARTIGALCESVYKLLRIKSEPPMTRFVASELATAHWFNIQAAKTDLGYRPLVSTEDGLARLRVWLKERDQSGSRS